MVETEKYWLDLFREGKIQVNLETGEVLSYLSGSWKPIGSHHSQGYLHASAGPTRKERYYILLHRLIWIIANGSIPEDLEINHKDGNKKNNSITNLEIVSHSENGLHSFRELGRRGIGQKGEANPKAKLRSQDVIIIRKLYESGKFTNVQLGRKYNVSPQCISAIVNYKNWKEVETSTRFLVGGEE